MNIEWSPFASTQLNDILNTIKEAQSLEVTLKWHAAIDNAIAALEDFPLIGTPLPSVTHKGFSGFFKGLRQIVIPPYRIVYEPENDRCEILFCQRTEQLLAPHER